MGCANGDCGEAQGYGGHVSRPGRPSSTSDGRAPLQRRCDGQRSRGALPDHRPSRFAAHQGVGKRRRGHSAAHRPNPTRQPSTSEPHRNCGLDRCSYASSRIPLSTSRRPRRRAPTRNVTMTAAANTVHTRAGEQSLAFTREFAAPVALVFRAHVGIRRRPRAADTRVADIRRPRPKPMPYRRLVAVHLCRTVRRDARFRPNR